MTVATMLTAEEFDARRHEWPDGGRWSELVRGVVTTHQPPDVSLGNVVLNLTKALGAHALRRPSGYACFDLGIVVARRPDSVWYPAVSWFAGGPTFAEVDHTLTEAIPALVVEIPSTNDRRRGLSERVVRWHELGVTLVCVIDSRENVVHELPRHAAPRKLVNDDVLRGAPVLEGFELPLRELFADPAWWRGPAK